MMRAALSFLATFLSLSVVHCDNIVEIASNADDFSTLAFLVTEADLADTLASDGRFLVYAPTNDAFASLPDGAVDFLLSNKEYLQDVLKYHVVAGGSLVGGEESDIQADNGIIRVIDTVLIPSSVLDALKTASRTIVDVASASPEFSTLVALIENAGLVDTLSGDGPFTVFAPTNDAFGALDADTVEYLLDSRNVRILQEVLKYHVVSGKVLAADLRNGAVDTVEGSPVQISLANTPPTVNGVDIVATDIETSNGVIHVISNVLVPRNFPPSRTCFYQGVDYVVNDWAKGPTLVCLCTNVGWVHCEPLSDSCGASCGRSDPCTGECSVCDPDTSMCVPDGHNRNLREVPKL